MAADVTLPERPSLPIRPENLLHFRLGRMLLLLDVMSSLARGATPLDIERLAYYEFFTANPFLLVLDTEERMRFTMAGFDSHTLSYQSAAQTFVNRRARLQHDLAILVGYGVIRAVVANQRVQYLITSNGQSVAAEMTALYATSFRDSAQRVVRRLSVLSDAGLREQAKEWLRADSLLIDLLDLDG